MTAAPAILRRVNPERFAELQRQRELVRAHLAWLDREIADERPSPAIIPAPPGSPVEPTVTPPPSGLAPAPDFAASLATDVSVGQYEPDSRSVAQSTRRGCLLAALGGFLLLAALLAAVFFLRYRDRPLLFMEHDSARGEKLQDPAAAPSPRK